MVFAVANTKSRAQKITEARRPQAADLPRQQAGLTLTKFVSNFLVLSAIEGFINPDQTYFPLFPKSP